MSTMELMMEARPLEGVQAVVRAPAARRRRAVVYARISRDRMGKGLGVSRQVQACRELTDTMDVDVVLVADDNDLSGYKRDRPRPGYEAVMALIAAGQVDVLVAWHVDRLTRRLSELSDLIALCQVHGVTVETVVAGAINPNNPSAVLQFQIAGAVAEYESAVKSERQKGKHKELREAGVAHGGIRMFGYNHDRTVRESEATWVRQVAARLINGESLRSCAAWLAAEGVETVRGGAWTGPNLRTYLMRPAVAGYITHGIGADKRPIIVGEATHGGILDKAQWHALEGLLGDPARRTASTNTRQHLLTGLATCGACGATVRIKVTGRRGLPSAYACGATGCGKVYRRRDAVDAQVVAFVEARLQAIDMRGLLADASESAELATLTADLDAVRDRATALATRYALGKMSDEAYELATVALEEERVRLTQAVDRLSALLAAPERALEDLTGPDPALVFADLPLSRQRAVIDVLASVVILPGARGGTRRYDPASVVITPKTR
jgi:site-specific DNA recombinase